VCEAWGIAQAARKCLERGEGCSEHGFRRSQPLPSAACSKNPGTLTLPTDCTCSAPRRTNSAPDAKGGLAAAAAEAVCSTHESRAALKREHAVRNGRPRRGWLAPCHEFPERPPAGAGTARAGLGPRTRNAVPALAAPPHPETHALCAGRAERYGGRRALRRHAAAHGALRAPSVVGLAGVLVAARRRGRRARAAAAAPPAGLAAHHPLHLGGAGRQAARRQLRRVCSAACAAGHHRVTRRCAAADGRAHDHTLDARSHRDAHVREALCHGHVLWAALPPELPRARSCACGRVRCSRRRSECLTHLALGPERGRARPAALLRPASCRAGAAWAWCRVPASSALSVLFILTLRRANAYRNMRDMPCPGRRLLAANRSPAGAMRLLAGRTGGRACKTGSNASGTECLWPGAASACQQGSRRKQAADASVVHADASLDSLARRGPKQLR